MPEEGIPLRDRAEFMTEEELIYIAKKFVEFGVKKIRLTGGEPLIKKNFASILDHLSQLPVSLHMTTNGVLLDKYFNDLEKAGLNHLNISLDTLQEDRFGTITRRKNFAGVYENIQEAIARGFKVKVNAVLIKDFNDDEILNFIELTKNNNLGIRFIEFMPFQGNKWDTTKKVSEEEVILKAANHFGHKNIIKSPFENNATARVFQVANYEGDFGIISTVTNPFCDTCNRLRLTADGKMKNCLFSNKETDLLTTLRNGGDITSLILENVKAKKKGLGGLSDLSKSLSENRPMTTIGG